jgi:multiple antibiotic resistance protein
MEIVHAFVMCFIPLLVAFDAPGTLPIFVGMTEDMDPQERKRIVFQSIITAFLVTLGFAFLGRLIFDALGIRVDDFMIAGGIVLLLIAINDILRAGEKKLPLSKELGVVPLGTPLIAGPAVLTTTLILLPIYGYIPVILSLIANLAIAWIIFAQADRIIRLIGISGSRAFAKVVALILAAFAVKLIRMGVFDIMKG